MKTAWFFAFVSLLLASQSCLVSAQTVIFQENFDQLQLRPPVDEESGITQAFTHEPPESVQELVESIRYPRGN